MLKVPNWAFIFLLMILDRLFKGPFLSFFLSFLCFSWTPSPCLTDADICKGPRGGFVFATAAKLQWHRRQRGGMEGEYGSCLFKCHFHKVNAYPPHLPPPPTHLLIREHGRSFFSPGCFCWLQWAELLAAAPSLC